MLITRHRPTGKQEIENMLYQYNLRHFPEDLHNRYEELNLYLQDEQNVIRGGLLAEICWNWLEIHTLMVDEELRHNGYGHKLLEEAERIARQKECDFIKVDTLSFQALSFYEKHGYKVYGRLEGVGREFEHYYLKKDLER